MTGFVDKYLIQAGTTSYSLSPWRAAGKTSLEIVLGHSCCKPDAWGSPWASQVRLAPAHLR